MSSNWETFLERFERGVEKLRQRANVSEQSPVVTVDQQTMLEPAPSIWIGTGNWDNIVPPNICLNNKGANELAGSTGYNSITELIEFCPEIISDRWRQAFERAKASPEPETFFSQYRLVVEDASPDSCFGLLFFLATLNGVTHDSVPANWRDYIKRWESGDVITTGLPEHSYGAFHSALYHSLMESDWNEAWIHALRLLCEGLKKGALPEDLRTDITGRELSLARSLVEYERQSYQDSLSRASTLQLALPLAGASARYRLVDAYVAEEHIALGLIKNFARTDTTNTFFRQGFKLMGLHRPHSDASIAFSVPPNSGFQLGDLWEELERLEDQAWAQRRRKRACDAPRREMSIIHNGRRPDGEPAPNNPWYINNDMTLVVAPRPGPDGTPETYLDWDEAIDALWHCYHPFKHLTLQSLEGENCHPEHCTPVNVPHKCGSRAPKNLFIAHWREPTHPEDYAGAVHYLRFTPAFKHYLAACIRPDITRPIKLKDLAQDDHFDFLDFRGGFGVVTNHGAFIINDWHQYPIAVEAITEEFNRVLRRIELLHQVTKEVARLYEETRLILEKGMSGKDSSYLLNRMAALKLRVGQQWTDTMASSFEDDVIAFRQTLERRFGTEGKLEFFYQTIERISDMLNSYIELRTNSRVAWLTIYGFPVLLFASFFSFIFQDLPVCPPFRVSIIQTMCANGVHITGLLSFLLLVLIGIAAFRVMNRRIEKKIKLRAVDYGFFEDTPQHELLVQSELKN